MAAPGTPQPEESPQAKARNQATQTHRGDGAYATRGRAARPGRGGWRHPDRPPEHPRPRELRRCAPEAVDLGAPDRPRHRWSREEGGGRRCGGVLAATASEEDICPLLVRTVEGSRLADDGYGMFYEGEGRGPPGYASGDHSRGRGPREMLDVVLAMASVGRCVRDSRYHGVRTLGVGW